MPAHSRKTRNRLIDLAEQHGFVLDRRTALRHFIFRHPTGRVVTAGGSDDPRAEKNFVANLRRVLAEINP